MPSQDILEGFGQAIRAATEAARPLRLRGSGTKDFYGEAGAGEPLDARPYAGIVDYEPTELVVTARCGTALAQLEAELAGSGQMLAFEPPHFGAATLGGTVSAGLSGPRRAAAGALRDFVLGIRIMDGHGQALSFGGRVMKNVAGYDVSRVMAGSLGTLALILEVSLKTLPRPVAEESVRLEMKEEDALRALAGWAGRLPLSASAWDAGQLTVRLSGASSAVRGARESIGGEHIERADEFWRSVRDQTAGFFTAPRPLWRISVPAATPREAFAVLEGERFIEWNGALRWIATAAEPAAVREAAARAGGHATLFRDPARRAGVFQPLAPAAMKIHRELKAVFDPRGVFNPGRMYPGL
jgi:glycolate oxidase FAD binding subunit